MWFIRTLPKDTIPMSTTLQMDRVSTLVLGADDTSCVNGAWIAELRELDRLEYNNQHTQTRRHCSLDAQDLKEWEGTIQVMIWNACSLNWK